MEGLGLLFKMSSTVWYGAEKGKDAFQFGGEKIKDTGSMGS